MSKDLIALYSKSRTVYSHNTGSASLSHLTRKPRTAAQEKAGRAENECEGNKERERKPLATPLTFPSTSPFSKCFVLIRFLLTQRVF